MLFRLASLRHALLPALGGLALLAAQSAEGALLFSTNVNNRVYSDSDTAAMTWSISEPTMIASVENAVDLLGGAAFFTSLDNLRINQQMNGATASFEFDFTTAALGGAIEELTAGFRRLRSDGTATGDDSRSITMTVDILTLADAIVGTLTASPLGVQGNANFTTTSTATGSVNVAALTTYTAKVNLSGSGGPFYVGLWDTLSASGTPVPEPASLALLGLGAALIVPRRRA